MMINLNFNSEVKKLGAKWNSEIKEWVPPKLAQKEFDNLKDKYFGDLVTIEVEGKFEGYMWGYQYVRTFAGYLLASARSRDGGAQQSEDIAVIKGGFSSGGSMKNYQCVYAEGTKVRMQIGKKVYEQFKDDERYKIELIGEAQEKYTLEEKINKCIGFLEKNGYAVTKLIEEKNEN